MSVLNVIFRESVRGLSRCRTLQTIPSLFCACAITSGNRQLGTSKHVLRTQSTEVAAPAIQSRIKELITSSDEPDTLYKKIEVLAKCHDRAVLDSYEYFAVLAAKELGITMEKVHEPSKKIERFTLLKSVHIYKKHRVQYEMRTHYRCFELKHLTGSTANVYLEYLQRNLPEGAALEITKTTLERLPDHIKKPVWDQLSNEDTGKNA
ncbi:28S ribosomal protein S10, mitochondrial [Spea bombifrons]|uniref:28S ribosomal protein S10, mitochondrial n=1 Tax=Spea bombifrons TaxID=233779 RepID=UPI002349BD94|nr:28S ribosomal protein S10, mitochondrial [Spea bombifrons]